MGLTCHVDKRVCGGPSCFTVLQTSMWGGKANSTVRRRRRGKHGKDFISKKLQTSQLYANCAWKAHRTEVHF